MPVAIHGTLEDLASPLFGRRPARASPLGPPAGLRRAAARPAAPSGVRLQRAPDPEIDGPPRRRFRQVGQRADHVGRKYGFGGLGLRPRHVGDARRPVAGARPDLEPGALHLDARSCGSCRRWRARTANSRAGRSRSTAVTTDWNASVEVVRAEVVAAGVDGHALEERRKTLRPEAARVDRVDRRVVVVRGAHEVVQQAPGSRADAAQAFAHQDDAPCGRRAGRRGAPPPTSRAEIVTSERSRSMSPRCRCASSTALRVGT